jgi:hypothetical protein
MIDTTDTRDWLRAMWINGLDVIGAAIRRDDCESDA